MTKEECIKEQAVDPTLKSLFELVCQESELENFPSGYFLKDGVLKVGSGSEWGASKQCCSGCGALKV